MTTSSSQKDSNIDLAIQDIVAEISTRRLESVAILFLEMHKPLCGLLNAGVLPFLHPFCMPFGVELAKMKLLQVLKDGESVESLICALEESVAERRGGDRV